MTVLKIRQVHVGDDVRKTCLFDFRPVSEIPKDGEQVLAEIKAGKWNKQEE